MDPLTHTLLGGVLADTGLRRRSGLATATLLVGANLPDVDVAAYFRGADAALHFRRGWTHGLLAVVVLPLVLTFLVAAFDRWRRRRGHEGAAVDPKQILLLSGLAVASHPLLDWLNTYGVRVFMPFDGRWLYGDAVFIVDPWTWLLFGGVLFLNHSRGSRSVWRWAALGALTTAFLFLGAGPYGWARWLWAAAVAGLAVARLRRRREPGDAECRRRARFALAAGAAYVVLMLGVTSWAESEVSDGLRSAGVEAAGSFMTGPDRVHPLVRLVVVPTGDDYRFGTFHPFRRPRLRWNDEAVPLLKPESLPGTEVSEVVAAARGAHCVRGMVTWVRYPFYELEPADGGCVVYILDARYVRGRTRGFGGAAVEVGRGLETVCR